jgi:hypothetical protein
VQALLILLSVVVALDLSVTLDPSVTPLNEWPMLQAHDAATTYLKSGLINRWAKTQQNGGISGMLNCAARAFDWRPTLTKDRKLLMHHGPDVINHPMSSALDELVAWSMAQPQKNSERFNEIQCYLPGGASIFVVAYLHFGRIFHSQSTLPPWMTVYSFA